MDAPQSPWSLCLDHAVVSDVGLRRANNQDASAAILAGDQVDFQHRGHFFMVADGMGAHAAGELASKMATDVVSLVYRKRVDQPPPEAILSALLDANHQIHTRGQASPDFRGMGTTATTLVLLPAGAMVAHVGDSRAYKLSGTCLEQLTFDHSLVWEVRAAGQPNAELPGYISKNIITRSLGPNAAVQVDLEGLYPVQAGDTFLLCSDGLCGQLSDEEIGLVLGCLPPAEAAQALVDLANLRGGPDNITVVVVRVLGPQVAHHSSTAEPARRAVPREVRPVHPAVWTLLGVAALATVGLMALGNMLAALVAFLAATTALIVAMVQRYGGPDRDADMEQRRLGRGPYVTCQCAPNASLLTRLTDLAGQLREATIKENRTVDWSVADGLLAQAASASRAGNLTDAARANLHALMHVMAQLRKLRDASSDSGSLAM
jgi:PPM family protein phosphatase